MKTINSKNTLKLSITLLFMISVGTAKAQTTDNTAVNSTKALAAGTSIKLIDNKGTIKYMQSNNGITTITSAVAGNKTTTTWQLGGSLVENTYIDVNGKVFSLDGVALESGNAATEAITGEIASGGNAIGSGWTFLVRDEATGAVNKLLASELVTGIIAVHTQAIDAIESVAIAVPSLPALSGNDLAKIFVYRNGVKLRAVTDFLVTAGTVLITYSVTDLPMYIGDIIEIHYIK